MLPTTTTYFPPSESEGGWRSLPGPDQVRARAGLDPARLDAARAWNAQFPVPSAVAVFRRGYLVAEWYHNGAGPATTFNIHSCSKSFTGTAYGLLFEDARGGSLAAARDLTLDSPAYRYIPAGHPLTDPRKAHITLRHLLSMTSGIPGESIGIGGVRVEPGINPFEAALGRFPVQSKGAPASRPVATLAAEPGDRWDYSDPAFAHLALAFHGITGRELGDFMRARVFEPLGLETISWDTLGLDDGRLGIHTCPFSGVHVTAREFARFGYLMLQGGAWNGRQIVPPWWLELATRSSQTSNPNYGLTWWVNTAGLWPDVPRDAFAAMGFNCNLCCVVPSLDLVIVRIGIGPKDSTEFIAAPFLGAIAQAVMPE